MTAHEESPHLEQREDYPVDQKWLGSATLTFYRRHLSGEIRLAVEAPKPGQNEAVMIMQAAERRAREVWNLASGAAFEKRRTTRGLGEKLRKYADYGLIGFAMAAGGTGLGLIGSSAEAMVKQQLGGEFPALVAAETDRYLAEEVATARAKDNEQAEAARLAEERKFDLTGLDKAATPERMARLMRETMPKGWTHNLKKVVFEPKAPSEDDSYGIEGGITLAEATMEADGKDVITFFASSIGDAKTNVSGNMFHELAHTLDWRHRWPLKPAEAEAMTTKVAKRLSEKDRFHSSYVEAINNPNKSIEREDKTVEYWAEISEAYFNLPDPEEVLPQEDLATVTEFVVRLDPHFEPAQAWEKRRAILDEMANENFSERLDTFLTHLPTAKEGGPNLPDLKERLQRHWLDNRFPVAAERQQEGRRALHDFVKRWSGKADDRAAVILMLEEKHVLDTFVRGIGDGTYVDDTPVEVTELCSVEIADYADTEIHREFRELEGRFSLPTDLRLAPGEYAELMLNDEVWPDPTYLISVMGYRPAETDKPLARQSTNNPAEAKIAAGIL